MTVFDMASEEFTSLLKENQELKKKYENAVADYEKTRFEKEQLNSLVNSCQEEIRQLKKQLEETRRCMEKAIEYINENWGHWCSNHYKYATETINILKGSD